MKRLFLLLALIATTITTAQISTGKYNYLKVENEQTGKVTEGYTNTTVTIGAIEADVIVDAFGERELYEITPFTKQQTTINGREYLINEGYNRRTNQKVLIIVTKDGTFGLKEGNEWVSFYNQ